MSHSCPECGMCCHCCGDIEDHDTGEEYTGRCTCCDGRDLIPDDDEDFADGPDHNQANDITGKPDHYKP